MVATLRDVVPLVALVVLLVVAALHVRPVLEATLALAATSATVATGVLSLPASRAQCARLLPVVLFLIAILVVAECCRAAGLFDAIGGRLLGAASPTRLFAWTFLAATVVTVTLSLDATVVLLTPVALVAAAGSSLGRGLQLVCVRLANSASLLLPVSNLTNLLAMPHLDLSFGRFALLMAPPWLLTLGLEYAGHRWWFRTAFAERPDRSAAPPPPPVARVPLVVLAVMLTGFAVGSRFGIAPAWIAGAAAAGLGIRSLRIGELGPRALARSAHLSFAVFVLALGVVVAGLTVGPLGHLVRHLVPHDDGLGALLGVTLLGAVLANLLNNLPATLLLVPLIAPLGTVPVLCSLIGINLGSSMTWPGSLANLLWRRSVVASGGRVVSRDFHGVGLLVTPAAMIGSVLLLNAWSGVL